jgi:hypothetical protein
MNGAVFCLSKTAYSAKTIQEHDRNLAIILSGIKAHFPSESTVVVDGKSHFFYSYRHIQYYLPEYKTYLADLRVNKRGEKWHTFGGVNGRTFLSDGIDLPARTKYVVYLTDPSDNGYKKELQSHDLSRLSLEDEIALYYRELQKRPLIET